MNEAETRIEHIGPCGYAGLRVTQCCELGITAGIEELQAQLAQNLIHGLQQHLHEKNGAVIPAKAGIQFLIVLDSRFRGNYEI